MSVTIDGSNGITFPNSSTQAVGFYGFKNRIINGAMVISQRGTSFSYNNNTAYCLDRYQVRYGSSGGTAGTATVTQSSSAPVGFVNSLLLTVGTARTNTSGDRFNIEQSIEGFNIADLGWGTANAKPITLSFWVNSSVTGTYGICFSNFSYGYAVNYSIPVANTWTQISVSIAGPTVGTWNTTNSAGFLVSFDLGMGSDVRESTGSWQAGTFLGANGSTNLVANAGATFYITGVQLEAGSTATSFDYRPYGTELALCQRYYTTLPSQNGTATGTGRTLGTCNGSNTAIAGNLFFPVSMRTAPTITIYGNASTTGNFNFYSAGSGAQATYTGSASSSTIANSSSVGFGLNMVVASLPASYSGWSDFSFSVGNFGISFTINAEL
jgi:hypothetical protein